MIHYNSTFENSSVPHEDFDTSESGKSKNKDDYNRDEGNAVEIAPYMDTLPCSFSI